ncbi:hypothetical protein BOTNAR_0359g00120 [Botryotinia narcissicola]|uniref:Uncharacterized protein n=1 Tax=Botryotinia narcissicola TaxID=278944 RepID=A0A4Z1HW68_9HELO|nr:hypothetical protein BOTNAR_0359g00120 [Botryotinia narcissicola]
MAGRASQQLDVPILKSSSLIDSEVIVTINSLQYLLVDCKPQSFLNLHSDLEKTSAFVVVSVNSGDKIDEKKLQEFRSIYLDPDDIFQPAFLNQIVFLGAEENEIDLQPSALSLFAKWNTKERYFVSSQNRKDDIAPGPYILYRGRIYEPWRVYNDETLSMMISFKPMGGYEKTEMLAELDNTFTANKVRMVVPSRSYSVVKSSDKPLSGVRIAVKDIFDIKGFRTSLCNRAWTEYHAPKSETALSVQRLQDLGAVIVGKTRLNAMLVREETMECVEFLAPFNPRGDGYHTPSGSSTGSCVALAAYPWLDFTLGSDTNGSCRKPAYWMGCFAIRPTTGVLDTHGVASFCPYFDVPAFFGRDISRFREFADLWYGSSPQLTKSGVESKAPTTILYPLDYLPTSNKAQMDFIDSFVRDLEGFLGVRKTEISLAEMWRNSSPKSAENIELSDYLETAGTLPYYKDACGKLEEFLEGYKRKFHKAPFFHQALRWRWEQANKTSPEARDEGWERIYTYRKWLLANVFKDGAIVVLPIDEGKPNNRENPPPGYSPLYLSPIAGTPEVTAPIGEITYFSQVTQREEPLPISVSVVSCPGTDLDLIDLVHEVLKAGGNPVSVAAGRSIFEK